MDEDAVVYERVALELTRLATALVGPAEAEDVVAEVVLKTLRRPGGLAGLSDARPYMVKAVINEARSRYRARYRAQHRRFHLVDAVALDDGTADLPGSSGRFGGGITPPSEGGNLPGLLGGAHSDKRRGDDGLPAGDGASLPAPCSPEAEGDNR
jgi:hypothetical protein